MPAFFAGHLLAMVRRPLPAMDSFLAATAQEHKPALITRNLKDVADLPVEAFNPWEQAEEPPA